MNIAIWLAFCLLASIGIVQVVGWVGCLFARPKNCKRGYCIVSLPEDAAALECQLRYALFCSRWGGGGQQPYIVLLDNGLDQEGQKICENMLRDVYGVFICTAKDLPETIRAFDNLQMDRQQI